MIKQTIPIEQIVNTREFPDDENLSALADSILESGLKQPLLLDENNVLIDGARRLAVLQGMGRTMVPVVISDNLEDTCKALTKVRTHGVHALPMSPKRTWELYNATQEQMVKRGREVRKSRVGIPRGGPYPQTERSRLMLTNALGYAGSEAQLAASTMLYKAFTTNLDPTRDAELARIQATLEAGDMSLYEARGALDRLGQKDLDGDIVTLSSQRDALATALAQLSGVMKGMARMGEINPSMDQTELVMYVKGYEEARRNLQRFINVLKKRVTTP